MPDGMSEKLSIGMRDKVPEQMSYIYTYIYVRQKLERMLDRMSGRMPDGMSDNASRKMPAQVPGKSQVECQYMSTVRVRPERMSDRI